ncbi:aspartate aminotransferase family protein [Olivibacter sp. SDN3]|uniref:aspartate aminotransferase family protein n=1 Tax=Olivibacter sp. SDN3 TaxID=2764720 RepID=UPI0016512735|nr:aspartate aminotransferase family protein [Olivibacter sp. SDN3]QNL49445.1 aspartate aminotransferase family protein [Olivibacter sp. SDN3]
MLNNRQLFLLNTAQTSTSPRLIEIEKAEGLYLYGPNGEKYMDLVSGFAVSNIGHRHPSVLRAIKDQLDKYLHVTVYGEFVQEPQINLATKLVSLLPQELNNVYFVNSGTEATEGAMKIAKKYTGRSEFIAAKKAYHGSTQGALSLMGDDKYKTPYGPLLPNIQYITYNSIADLSKITSNTAAVVLEAVQGEAGVRIPNVHYIQKLRSICNETGTLLIFDEIQTGFGRTGKLFAFEHYKIVPDILLTAKGLGGGMPLGAFITRHEIMDVIKDNPILGHITTFGGHPVSCAAALASLNVILDENLMAGVDKKHQIFKQQLKHPLIREVRGLGLMMCIQLDTFEQVEKVSKYCANNGVLVDWFLHHETALRISPPLIITEEEIINACTVIKEGLDNL